MILFCNVFFDYAVYKNGIALFSIIPYIFIQCKSSVEALSIEIKMIYSSKSSEKCVRLLFCC